MADTFYIDVMKPPPDVWAIAVDFAARLDIERDEEIDLVNVEGYRIHDYDETLQEFNLSGVSRINVELQRLGASSTFYSFLGAGRPTALLRVPMDYDPIEDSSVIDRDSVVCGPGANGPTSHNTTVSFHIQHGLDGARYMAVVTVVTTLGRQHSCEVQWRVRRLPYTNEG